MTSDKLINGKWQVSVVCRACGWVGERRSQYGKPCPKCGSGRVDRSNLREASQ